MPGSDTVDTGSYADGEKFLDQNWSHDERLEYYYTSQGSAALHYGIFVAVEQADTQDLFRSNANLARFGFITQSETISGGNQCLWIVLANIGLKL